MGTLLNGCEMLGQENRASDFCSVARPIYVSETDVFSDTTARAILNHNEKGRSICGWKSQ